MRLTASQAREGLRERRFSVVDYADALLCRIEAREDFVHAWQCLDPAMVRDQARLLDARAASGHLPPLHGLPIGVKDVFLTKDFPTEFNSPIYRGHASSIDAAAVALLRHAGALVLGKTTTVEFAATGAAPPTRNPCDIDRTPGGSSSGSAAAVADFHVPLALGTQTGGSLIRPASFCGVAALKPTWGTVSTEGVHQFAPSLDTVGWFGRCVADLALILDVLAPWPPGSETRAGRGKAHVGVCRTDSWAAAEPATADALQRAADLLAAQPNVEVSGIDLPPQLDGLAGAHEAVMRAEGGVSFLPEYRRETRLLSPGIRALVEGRHSLDPAALAAAHDLAAVARTTFDAFASRFDAILTPSVPGEAPLAAEGTGSFVFNGSWTLLHVPCVHVPGFRGSRGLPVGVTLTGARFCDRRVLRIAALLEHALAAS